MKNGQLKLNGKRPSNFQKSPILVNDMMRYLSSLAKLHRQDKTGNIDLSNGLQELSNALRPYADYPVTELSDALKVKTAPISAPNVPSRKAASRNPKLGLPSDLGSASQEEVEKILESDNYTKQQIAEIGFQRFGMSKPMLQRLRKEEAKRSVRSALENERTLDVISKMARKAGKARAS